MKLFGRSGGYYLFWTSVVYLVIGFLNIHYEFTRVEFIQMVWVLVMALPLTIKPIARYMNMRTVWECDDV